MAGKPLSNVRQFLRKLVGFGQVTLADELLLARYVETRDEAAFTALVHRYGPMVLGVCERMLPDGNDAEDAFQAAFMVLVRRAAELDRSRSLGPWLYTVAYRSAAKVRAARGRHSSRETEGLDMLAVDTGGDASWDTLRPLLDEELYGLPEKERELLVLCYIEGKTQQEAARELGIPEGSVSRVLCQARDLLRSRLARRGVLASAAALFALWPSKACAASLPAGLVDATVRSATSVHTATGFLAMGTKPVALKSALIGGGGISKAGAGVLWPGAFLLVAAATWLGVFLYRAEIGTTGVQTAKQQANEVKARH
jgi:RNA polymerase sigma factor (sigma-70 family)